jgi:hypothetical protein
MTCAANAGIDRMRICYYCLKWQILFYFFAKLLKQRLNIALALPVNRTTAVILPDSASAAFNREIIK